MEFRELASGLQFPEGPVAMDDGSVIVVEIAAGRITRVKKDGKTQTIASPGGGPNGLAIGPDGALYVCNNGGSFTYSNIQGMNVPGHAPDSHRGGRIERVDISTGKVETLYHTCDGKHLIGPNDIVFDSTGGFWFTDYGKTTGEFRTHGALYYARADGSKIARVLPELISPNGVGLSPDGRVVYFAETFTGRLWSLPLDAPGKPSPATGIFPAQFVGAYPGFGYFDSLGVEAAGAVSIGTLVSGGITTFWPGTKKVKVVPISDLLVTNICWGGKAMKTAYITSSGWGKLLVATWPRAGLRLNYNA